MSYVIDASVAVKWFFSHELNAMQAVALSNDEPLLIAPDLLVTETCSAAWKWFRLGRINADELIEIAERVPLFFDELVGAAELAPRAVAIANALAHPVYDCFYLALAEARGIPLITADARLLGRIADTPWAARVRRLADYRPTA